jgi:hypothetical protein
MSFLPTDQLAELIHFAAIADKEARSDLSLGFIKDENDYTSNFTGALRRIINSNSQTGLSASSFLLQHSEEREMGADAAIILSRGSESKVAVFEAKWPRFMNPGYEWDYQQTASGLSHFSDQLERQAHWHGRFAIFEMFYSEYAFGAQPPFLDANGSSCVWHEDADAFRKHRPSPESLWSQADLQKLLSAHQVNIAEVMKELGICNQGKPIRMVEPAAIGREFRLPPRLLTINANIERARRQE